MKREDREYVQYRLERARDAFDVARLAVENSHCADAVNRLYYACFYAVTALLHTDGLASTKHTGIRALFDQHYIRTGRLPVPYGRLYRSLFDFRQESDYGDRITYTQQDVQHWMTEVAAFIEGIATVLDDRLRDGTP